MNPDFFILFLTFDLAGTAVGIKLLLYIVCRKYASISVAAAALAHDHISDVQASAV